MGVCFSVTACRVAAHIVRLAVLEPGDNMIGKPILCARRSWANNCLLMYRNQIRGTATLRCIHMMICTFFTLPRLTF
jgi:hypothetical protein